MKQKIYNEFWDNFNTKLYENILEEKNEVLQIRINKYVKNEFKKNCVNKGGVTNVLTVFIKEVNRLEK